MFSPWYIAPLVYFFPRKCVPTSILMDKTSSQWKVFRILWNLTCLDERVHTSRVFFCSYIFFFFFSNHFLSSNHCLCRGTAPEKHAHRYHQQELHAQVSYTVSKGHMAHCQCRHTSFFLFLSHSHAHIYRLPSSFPRRTHAVKHSLLSLNDISFNTFSVSVQLHNFSYN